MKRFAVVLLSVFFLFVFTTEANAIIILPAVILIPIAKLIALIIGGFSLPVVGTSAFLSKIWGKSFAKGIIVGLGILILLSIIIALIMKFIDPSRPLI